MILRAEKVKDLSFLNYYDGDKILNCVTSFDIETTAIKEIENSFMYIFQFAFENDVIIGRYWRDFVTVIEVLEKYLEFREINMIIYVHNLSFEFQFIRTIIPITDVFLLDKRKVLSFRYKKIEFRCSFLLYNASLNKFTKDMNVKHQKMSGKDFDYTVERFGDTPLTYSEYKYAIYDVIGLNEAIHQLMEAYGDTLETIPYTRTGYIRRVISNRIAYKQRRLNSLYPFDIELYVLLQEAFRGGDSHANRIFSGKILHNIDSDDFSSDYPYQICAKKYPKKFVKYCGEVDKDKIDKWINVRGRAILMRISLFGIRIKTLSPDPYLSYHKCRRVVKPILDNGRILYADYLETTCTDIDYKIILDCYDFDDFKCIEVYTAAYEYMDDDIIDETLKLYKEKTLLKGGDSILYALKKGDLNSIYGMMVQDLMKKRYVYNNNIITLEDINDDGKMMEVKKKFFKLPYQWGVWVTAHARYDLHQIIKMLDDCYYWDTDSSKHKHSLKNDRIIEEFNRKRMNKKFSAEDSKGKRHYMGLLERDGEYNRFITLGSKKYCYEDKESNLFITVSGINKEEGRKELEKKGGIEKFKCGEVFTHSAGTRSVYNDEYKCDLIYKGRLIELCSNVYICNTTYTLGITKEYEELIKNFEKSCTEMLDLYNKRWYY